MSTSVDIPRLMLIADGFTRPDIAARTIDAAKAGVPWIQLRDHRANEQDFESVADDLLDAVARLPESPLTSVNSRLDFADTRRTAFHTGAHGPTVSEAIRRFGVDTVVGASVHSVAEAREALAEGVTYVAFSPVYPTSSKPGHPGQGLSALRAIVEAIAPIPVLALGGVTPERAAACRHAGAHGVAVVRGILEADDIDQAVRLYSDSLSQAQAPDAS